MAAWRIEDHVKRAVNNALPKTVHKQSMTAASMTANGIPDHYYDGTERDLWNEFKFWERSLKSSSIVGGVDANKRGYYSPLQYAWMSRRWAVGRNVIGMIGLPDNRVVIQRTPGEWVHGTDLSTTPTYTAKEAAAWVINFIGS